MGLSPYGFMTFNPDILRFEFNDDSLVILSVMSPN